MKSWEIYFYLSAILMHLSSIFCVLLILRKTQYYKAQVLYLIFGLVLMVVDRTRFYIDCCTFERYDIFDIVLSNLIAIFFLVGGLGIRAILLLVEKQKKQLERFNKTDYLTGLSSRFEVESRIEEEIQRSFRTQHPVSVLMIDIDHFKTVNDTYGHPVGDRVLKSLADLCLSLFREIDVVGRVGGEEFLVLLPKTSMDEAFEVAERFRISVEKHIFTYVSNQEIKIQVSVGVSTLRSCKGIAQDAHLLMEQCIKNADNAMYKAKQIGRNRTYCCDK
jgi:diguanylate cyclase (GGDEF)-like protein